ncbi:MULTISPECIES: 3-dehydroquinate synthase [unclassified Fusibacter]|uniref:3-dehydroquinate synthase n=1 Tax=unclassified Fusibacter TaxID=2624464 RepID=UPI0013E9942E|nr:MULTISPECIES: 3-dehydroquinate synthase [unclassified Fusibacter]MCK8059948.1 3-dehydroquinate synthase [Fusibacter sp. A2]NPE22090.1 3-dehydroquinate synthase [Fusibacter sp. A1]
MSLSAKYVLKPDSGTKELVSLANGRRIFLVVDRQVSMLHKSWIDQLLDNSLVVGMYDKIGGETDKNFENVQLILNQLLELELNRDDLLIAIGGGVVTDVSGFVASIYKRGMPWIACPTTLLGMIDAAIGGKTAVNTSFGKNLIGTFHEPEKIFYRLDFLKTLPRKEWLNGLGELQKYGMIYDKSLFDFVVEKGEKWADHISEVIESCVNYKLEIVHSDLKESSHRMVLNFGHTFGHCLEKEFDYKGFGHGESVMYGIVIALSLSKNMIGMDERIYLEFLQWMSSEPWFDSSVYKHPQWFINGLRQDKKIRENKLNLILLKDYGCPVIHSIEETELVEVLRGIFSEINQDLIKENWR